MRDVINKGLTEEDILGGAMEAFEGGWNRVKLYFMLGLPTETFDDIEGIAELSNKIAALFYTIPKDRRPGGGRVEIVTSTSFLCRSRLRRFSGCGRTTAKNFLKSSASSMERSKNSSIKRVLNITGMTWN